MATRRLYHDDSTLLAAEALLVRQEEAGGKYGVVLDRTVVFPGGGGQPADRGWIEEREIVGIEVVGDDVVHYLSSPLEGRVPGSTVRVRVDEARRREMAQQHTGQHIVSASLLAVGGFQTVSVHMGEDAMTVESPVPAISEEALRAVEELSNSVIRRDVPVRTHLVGEEELARFKLRRAASQRELYRVVEIEGHDASACGGVHVTRTGEVGLLKCLGAEKIRGNCRTIWLAGDRAYRDYATKHELTRLLGAELSAPAEGLLDAVRRLKEENAGLQADLERAELAAARTEAAALIAGGERCPGATLVIHALEGGGRSYLRALGAELGSRAGVVALLACREGDSAPLYACCAEGVGVELAAVLKPLLPEAGGKGGGRGGVWQGSVDPARLDRFLAAAGAALRAACGGSA